MTSSDLVGLDFVRERINELSNTSGLELGSRFDHRPDGAVSRLKAVDAKLAAVDLHISRVEQRMDRLKGSVDGIEPRLRGLEIAAAARDDILPVLVTRRLFMLGLLLLAVGTCALVIFGQDLRGAFSP